MGTASKEQVASVLAAVCHLEVSGIPNDSTDALALAVCHGNIAVRPELAAFLRKLDSLKRILGTKTTLILDTEATPFDIFKIKVGSLEQENAPKK